MKKWYKLTFEQKQPIHIGMGSYGVVNETRIFIPGWTMWGALTKAYNLYNGNNLSENQQLFENISCFYPAFKNADNLEILFPEFKNGEFYLGDYSEDKFRAKFVYTFVSTAINPATNAALDESLHEINVILPGAKAEYLENPMEGKIYWVGILGIDNDSPDKFLTDGLEVLVGGDSRYGLGKMTLIKKENIGDRLPDEWKESKGFLRNYYPANGKGEGKIELLTELEKAWEGAELRIKATGFYYIPGTKISLPEGIKLKKGRLK